MGSEHDSKPKTSSSPIASGSPPPVTTLSGQDPGETRRSPADDEDQQPEEHAPLQVDVRSDSLTFNLIYRIDHF